MSGLFNPPHPGRILKESLDYLGISTRRFARDIGVSPSMVAKVLKEEAPIRPELAIRISAAMPGPSPEVWLSIQASYDLWQVRDRLDVSSITRLVPSSVNL